MTGPFWTHSMFVLVFVFLYGVTLGSFYNVIIYRVPLSLSVAKGRSFCPSCGHTLAAADLVPLFSWIFLRGRCRYCKEKISPRYFVIELVSGLLFALAYWLYGLNFQFLFYAALWSMLLITMFIDIDHMVIDDAVLVVFSVIGLMCLLIRLAGTLVNEGFRFTPEGFSKLPELGGPVLDHAMGAAAGFGVYFAIYFIAKLIYGREAFGFGDVLLMSAAGLFLGFRDALLAAFLAFYAGLMFLIALAVMRKFKMKKEIPFGPSICIAAFASSLFGDRLFAFYKSITGL